MNRTKIVLALTTTALLSVSACGSSSGGNPLSTGSASAVRRWRVVR